MRPFDAYDLDDPDGTRINVPHEFRNVQDQEYVVLTLPIEIDSFARPILDPTLVLQPDATDGIDSRINEFSKPSNYGTSAEISIGESKNFASHAVRTLIKFDLTSIPASAAVSSAQLSLYMYFNDSSNARTHRVFRTLRDWVENQVSWNNYSSGNAWSTAGGFHADDCEQTDIGSLAIAEPATLNQFYDWDLTPAGVEGWISGALTNYGLLGKTDTELNDMHGYKSSDEAIASKRPKLTVAYTVSAAAPSNLAAVVC